MSDVTQEILGSGQSENDRSAPLTQNTRAEVTNQLPLRIRNERTIGEAEQFRAGWECSRAMALRQVSEAMDQRQGYTPALMVALEALLAMEPPA